MTPYASGKDWTLYHGNCLEILPTLSGIDAVVTDPPYGIDYQSDWRTDKKKRLPKIANDGQPFVWFLAGAAESLSDGGRILCFCRWDTAEAFRLAIGWAGVKLRAQIIWDREHHGMGDTRGSPSPQHDTIWYATKGRYEFKNARPSSVVRSARISGGSLSHPNEKPIGLMTQLVLAYTTTRETVVDPFTGSGTTGVACIRTGRKFIGIELDGGYCEIAAKRLREAEASLLATA